MHHEETVAAPGNLAALDRERVDPARRAWRFFLRQKKAVRTAWVAHQRAKSRAAILKTAPIPFDSHADIEIHALTCERDYTDLLWCLKTLFLYAERRFNVVLHDDGSLTPEALRHLSEHLPGTIVVSPRQADERMHAVMAGYPACRTFRDRLPLARKLFDFPAFAGGDRFLVLDSDVLFFRRPDEMLRLLESGEPFTMADYQDGYVFSRDQIAERYGVNVLPAVNTGVCCMTRDMCDYDLLDRCCRDLDAAGLLSHGWAEQTLIAIMFSKPGRRMARLSAAYGIAGQPIGPETVCHHFVNDGSRDLFYTRGIQRLRMTGFLAAYARRFGSSS